MGKYKNLLFASGKTGPDPEYIGSVIDPEAPGTSYKFSSAQGGLDVFGIPGVAVGDLVVIAYSFDASNTTNNAYRTWSGMTITAIQSPTSYQAPGFYLGYGFIQSGDTNPYLATTSATVFRGLSAMASVFRGVTTLDETTETTGLGGMPNTPTLGSGSKLYVRVGHLDDDIITTCSAPTGHTLAGYATGSHQSSYRSSTMLAYGFGGPTTGGTFGGDKGDSHAGTAARFS